MSHHESAAVGADARLADRMLFFTDAVFAIVLTLLALELRPPEAAIRDEAALLQGIADQARYFASFAISFALGAAFWLAHLRTSRLIRVFDWPTAIVNLVHLLTVALLPFAAALLGQHIYSAVAFSGYGVVIVLVSFTGALFWLTATRGKGRIVGGISTRQRIAGAIRAGAIGVAFVVGLVLIHYGEVMLARFCWVLIFPLLLIARLIGGKQPRPAAS
ncbi:MAG TPA: TMEM175 family protein [Caulobacterales bacterium]|nr:TMEM175 family protein [Caulobacterales bacterium]